MKRCPTCHRAFTDDTLSFCLEDGTPLISERAGGPDAEATLVSPSPRTTGDPTQGVQETVAYHQMAGAGAPYRPPGYVAQPQQRKVWPWVVALVALFLIGGGFILAAVILIPRLNDHSISINSNREPTPVVTSSPWPSSEPTPSPSIDDDQAPTDHDEVLADLEDLEEEWERANVEGDRDTLETILADEYVGDNNASKKSYLESLAPQPGRTWKYSNFALALDGNRALLSYRLDRITGENVNSLSYLDTFVWRGGRWQATSSRQVR